MKKGFLFISFLLSISFIAKTQDYKNEIGINLFKYNAQFFHNTSSIDYRVQYAFWEYNELGNTDYNLYKTILMPQLFYSNRLNKNIKWRSEFQYLHSATNRSTYKLINNPLYLKDNGSESINTNRYYLASGLQYSFWSHKKVHPYIFGMATFNSIFTELKVYNLDSQLTYSGKYDPKYKLAYALGIGCQYQYSKRISTSIELTENATFESHFLSRLSINYHF